MDGQTYVLRNDGASEWTDFESPRLAMGVHSLDMAVLSNPAEFDPKFVSKAQVLIKSAALDGSDTGGATKCLKCPAN